jgi:raffinose/stachyose/melibiose transport system substrate-binding protein
MIMKPHSFVYGLLVIVLVFAMAGCQPAAPAPAEATQPPAQAEATQPPAPAEVTQPPAPVTLKLWYLSGSPQEMDVITTQVEKFQEAHPDIVVDLSFYGADTYTNTTTLAMNSGTGPDLFYGDIGYVNFGIAFAKNGLIRDLTDIIQQRGWDERFGTPLPWQWFWDAQTPGHYYGLPYDYTTVGVYYNESVFKELGLEPPTTFAEFQNVLATIKEKKPEIAPISVGAGDGWPLGHVYEQILHSTVPFEELKKLALFPAVEGSWDQPGAVEAASILQDWATKGYFQENYLAASNDDAINMFMTGKSALLIAGTWNSGTLSPVTEFPVRFFAMPPVHTDINPDGSWHMGGFTINNPWYVNAASQYQDQTLELLDYMLGKETAIAQWDIGDTVAYTFPEGEVPALVYPFQKDIYDAMHDTQSGFYLDMPIYLDEANGYLQSMVAGKMTPEEFVKEKQDLFARAYSESK